MDKEEYHALSKKYSTNVKTIIDDNVKYYRFNQTIQWHFGFSDDVAIMGECNRETNVITLNIKSVDKAYTENHEKDVEYFLLHEIRHINQHLIIDAYKKNIDVDIDPRIIDKWIYEGEHYVKAIDDNGNENKEYFLQDSEMDAYAYSYAVMKYKYGNVDELYVPEIYGGEFYLIVDEWINQFKAEQI